MAGLEQEHFKRGLRRVKASDGVLLREPSLGSDRGCQGAGNPVTPDHLGGERVSFGLSEELPRDLT